MPGDFGVFRGRVDFGDESLSLQNRRFERRRPSATQPAGEVAAKAAGPHRRDGLLRLLETPEHIELAVKILDGRPLTGSFWRFYASLTRQEFELEVRDLEQGEVRRYHHPGGTLASFADFGGLQNPPPFAPRLAPTTEPAPVNLAGGRFLATVEWHDFSGNTYGNGHDVHLADDATAAFHFFWPANLELFVRIADHRNEIGHFG